MRNQELSKAVNVMPFKNAVKALALLESELRRHLDKDKQLLRLTLETTFSDPFPQDGKTDLFLEEIGELKKTYAEFSKLRRILKERYKKEIQKGKRANGLKTCRYSRVNFLLPNI